MKKHPRKGTWLMQKENRTVYRVEEDTQGRVRLKLRLYGYFEEDDKTFCDIDPVWSMSYTVMSMVNWDEFKKIKSPFGRRVNLKEKLDV